MDGVTFMSALLRLRSLVLLLGVALLSACAGLPSTVPGSAAVARAPIAPVERVALDLTAAPVDRPAPVTVDLATMGYGFGDRYIQLAQADGSDIPLYASVAKVTLDCNFTAFSAQAWAGTTGSPCGPVTPSFSQTTLSTVVGPTGAETFAPNNLLTHSNDFTNAVWTKQNVTPTPGVADPVGGTGATTLTSGATNSQIFEQVAGLSNGLGTNFISGCSLRRRSGAGAVELFSPNDAGLPSVTLTSSWQQFNTNGVGLSGSAFVGIRITTSGDAIDAYGCGLSAAMAETTPRPQDQVITGASPYLGLRYDYSCAFPLVQACGPLIEQASADTALNNRDLTTASWTKSNVTAAHNATGLDGVANSASTITALAANGTVLQSLTAASNAQDFSPSVKRVTGTGEVDITLNGGTSWTNIVSLINSSNYVRVSTTATVTNPQIGFRIVTNGDAVAVDCAQLEALGFYTSCMPTGASQVSRTADVLTAPLPAACASGGTMQADAMWNQVITGSSLQAGEISTSAGDSNNLALLDINGTAKPTAFIISGGTTELLASAASAVAANVLQRMSVTYGTRSNGYWNGSLLGSTNNTVAPVGIGKVYLGGRHGGTNQLNGWLQRLTLWCPPLSQPRAQQNSLTW